MKGNYFKQMLTLVLIFSILAMISCEKNPVEAPEQPAKPALPPESSMKLDLSFFNTSSLAKTTAFSKKNWTNAALRVLVINATVLIGTAVPVALFLKAASQEAEWNSDDAKFHWIYSITYENNSFEADLAGWIDVDNKSVVWEMYVSSNTHVPELVKFLYYEGHCNIDNKGGYWILYHDKFPEMKKEWYRIDWTNEGDKHTLAFRNILSESEYENDELKYWVDGSERKITFFDASENVEAEIYWDAVTGAGYIWAPDYNDGKKACWDENQNDIECP